MTVYRLPTYRLNPLNVAETVKTLSATIAVVGTLAIGNPQVSPTATPLANGSEVSYCLQIKQKDNRRKRKHDLSKQHIGQNTNADIIVFENQPSANTQNIAIDFNQRTTLPPFENKDSINSEHNRVGLSQVRNNYYRLIKAMNEALVEQHPIATREVCDTVEKILHLVNPILNTDGTLDFIASSKDGGLFLRFSRPGVKYTIEVYNDNEDVLLISRDHQPMQAWDVSHTDLINKVKEIVS